MDDVYLPVKHHQCGQTAFSIRKASVVFGAPILAEHVRLADGSQPINGDKMTCGSCGSDVSAPYEPVQRIHEQGYATVYTPGVMASS